MLDNYPPGAKYDANAPYNEYTPPEKEFEVCVTQELSKYVGITTNNYAHYVDEDEDGYCEWDDTSNTEWDKEFYENDYHDPLALINLFKEFLEEQLEKGIAFKSPAFTKRLIEECEGWEEDELQFTE